MAPNRERESLAFAIMVDELSRNPGNLLQRLVEVVTGVCGVGTAAVAMTDGNALGWDAAAGPMADSPRWTALHRAGAARSWRRRAPGGRRRRAIARVPSAVTRSRPVVDAQAIPLQHDGSHGRRAVDRQSRGRPRRSPPMTNASWESLAQLASSAWTTWARGEATRRASDRKSELLALVSHELRNPLNTIATAASASCAICGPDSDWRLPALSTSSRGSVGSCRAWSPISSTPPGSTMASSTCSSPRSTSGRSWSTPWRRGASRIERHGHSAVDGSRRRDR